MTTKDYVYLGLIALAALVFYCHGFNAGVRRSRKTFEPLLADLEESASAPIGGGPEPLVLLPPERNSGFRFGSREEHGEFGNN
jgi:hypothetical protein